MVESQNILDKQDLKMRLSLGFCMFLLLLLGYQAVPNELMGAYMEKQVSLVSYFLNQFLNEETIVLFESQLGFRIVIRESAQQITSVTYDLAYLSYSVLCLFLAVVIFWPASLVRKIVVISITVPTIVLTNFCLMLCAYFIEIYVPLYFLFFKNWVLPVAPSLLLVLIFYFYANVSQQRKTS